MKKVMKNTYIGLKYKPIDNSFSVNLTSASTEPYENLRPYLAGTFYTQPKICTIISEPFEMFINSSFRKVKMILVEYNETTNVVLFDERCIIYDFFENGIPFEWDGQGI